MRPTLDAANLERMTTFTETQINEHLAGLEGWTTDGTAIEKRFEFDDFKAAFAFMTTAAPKIDALDHHPEWTNVYNRVDVRLSSHDVGGVTERDLELAGILDRIATAQ